MPHVQPAITHNPAPIQSTNHVRNAGSEASAKAADIAYGKLRYLLNREVDDQQIGLKAIGKKGGHVSKKRLDEILNESLIAQAFPWNTELNAFMTDVTGSAKKLTAVIVRTFEQRANGQRAIERLLQCGYSDEHLPLLEEDLKKLKSHCNPTTGKWLLHESCQCDKSLEGFHDPRWDYSTLRTFYEQQWPFCIADFRTLSFGESLETSTTLPFVWQDLHSIGDSTFSTVKKEYMLTEYQKFIDATDDDQVKHSVPVAVKILKNKPDDLKDFNVSEAFRREVSAHEDMNSLEDSNIVRMIGAFEQDENYCLIFEFANGGNLQEFVDQEEFSKPLVSSATDRVQSSRDLIRHIFEQFHGIANATRKMHDIAENRSRRNSNASDSLGPSRTQREERPTGDADAKFPEPDATAGAERSPRSPGAAKANVASDLPVPIFDITAPESDTEAIDDEDEGVPDVTVAPSPNENELHADNGVRPRMQRMSTVAVNENADENWRHGDIKMANILLFKKSGTSYYLWKLADFGRAKKHTVRTELRKTHETELFRTKAFEPPDLYVPPRHHVLISRRFDIWSLGCVFLCIISTLLYGNEYQQDFMDADPPTGIAIGTPFWRKDSKMSKFAKISETTNMLMTFITENDPEKGCLLGDLVRIIKKRMLQVLEAQTSDSIGQGHRCTAAELVEELDGLAIRVKDPKLGPGYVFSGKDRSQVKPPAFDELVKINESLHPEAAALQRPSRARRAGPATRIQRDKDYTINIENKWKYSKQSGRPDLQLGQKLNRELQKLGPSSTCRRCGTIDFAAARIVFPFNRKSGTECQTCAVIVRALRNAGLSHAENVELKRVESGFMLEGTDTLVLRTFDSSGAIPQSTSTCGLPIVHLDPENDRQFFSRLSNWIATCDTHDGCQKPGDSSPSLPTRLLDLCSFDYGTIRVVDTKNMQADQTPYIALSHRWGPRDKVPLCSYSSNIDEHKRGIPLSKLPKNFSDAARVCIELNIFYLWIDCLCIIQGKDGDFGDEKEKIEATYANAECVIAACSSESSWDGFLGARTPFEYVRLPTRDRSKSDLFMCENPDSFQRDVVHSGLEKRGWVFQEHALARKTLFFTNRQVYFECGKGIWCETLTQLENAEVAFLGDSQFPKYAVGENSSRGGQIYLLSRLFTQYSSLDFSYAQDRPVAIDGMLRRATRTLKDESVAGLFKEYWGRCLLWRRAGRSMTLIDFTPDSQTDRQVCRSPPSWSWMAWDGVIDFIAIGDDTLNWNEYKEKIRVEGIRLPKMDNGRSMSAGNTTSWLSTSRYEDSLAIEGTAYTFDIEPGTGENEASIYHDAGEMMPAGQLRCIIVGSQKMHLSSEDIRKHYVLIVRQKANEHYERVGAGSLVGRFINLKSGIRVFVE